jgi:hypothetical protein
MKAYIIEMDGHLHDRFLDNDESPEMHWDEYKRAEWMDEYAPGPVPAEAWMDHGYTHTCFQCEHVLSLDEGYCDHCSGEHEDEERPENAGICFDGDMVFCGEGCKTDFHAERVAMRVARDDCEQAILTRLPFITIVRSWIGSPGDCKCFNTNPINAACEFSFPGSKTNWNHYCNGCKKMSICRGDAQAFQELQGITNAPI